MSTLMNTLSTQSTLVPTKANEDKAFAQQAMSQEKADHDNSKYTAPSTAQTDKFDLNHDSRISSNEIRQATPANDEENAALTAAAFDIRTQYENDQA